MRNRHAHGERHRSCDGSGDVHRGSKELRGRSSVRTMKRAFALLLLAFGILGTAGCGAAFEKFVTPKPGDYPCAQGADFVYCGDHTCCYPNEFCRSHDYTSNEPFCEYSGPDDTGNFGAKQRHPRLASGRP
jgi:hypothetical protein